MMKFKNTRKAALILHVIAALYNCAFIYTPLHNWQYGLVVVQFVTFPLLCITGFWMMYGKKLHKKVHQKYAK